MPVLPRTRLRRVVPLVPVDGQEPAAIEQAWRAAMWTKKAGHGINDPDFIQPDRPMSAIGG